MSKPMDWAFLDPVFMMFPMSRMISRILANFLDFRTSSQAAVAATIWGLQSCTSSGYLCWNMSDFSLGTSLLMPEIEIENCSASGKLSYSFSNSFNLLSSSGGGMYWMRAWRRFSVKTSVSHLSMQILSSS